MSLKAIQLVLFDVLQEVQKMSGHEWDDLKDSDIPLDVLPGFDSLCSVEATVMVEEKLGCGELKTNSLSIFISPDGTKPLSIVESSILIESLINKKKGKK